MNWKNQYHQNDCTIQGNLQTQCSPYQIPMKFFIELDQKNFTVCTETQIGVFGKELEESDSLISDDNQNSMVLAQIQKYIPSVF